MIISQNDQNWIES